MLGAVCLWIFCSFAIFNHFTAEPVRIAVFQNDFLCAQITGDLCYSLISRFNRRSNESGRRYN
ncbi:hypothetical protein [Mediterraneibacter gnavus]|uniref:hypothetical protein n=1 Tax=Mediterraneibacter gnavus TaxID=33038 RepID=UPI0015FAEB93|nr:hypothetical protein [Mediterraneibacter gnavus]